MPLHARCAQILTATFLFIFAAYSAWKVINGEASHLTLLYPFAALAALVGLIRRVAWGRFLVSCFYVFAAFVVAAVLTPNLDDMYDGGTALEGIFGKMPPNWASWLFIVGSVTLVLMPAVVLGLQKEWFRNESW